MYLRRIDLTSPFVDLMQREVKAFVQPKQGVFIGLFWPAQAIIDAINVEFSRFGFPAFDQCLVFHWPKGEKHMIHVDWAPGGYRYSAVNIIVQGGEGSKFQWFSVTDMVYTDMPKLDLKAWHIKDEDATLIHEEPTTTPYISRTDIPHRIYNEAPKTLLSLRFKGNPTYDELIARL